MSAYFPFEGKNNCEHNSFVIFSSKIKYYCDSLVLMICNTKSDDAGFQAVSATMAKIDRDHELS